MSEFKLESLPCMYQSRWCRVPREVCVPTDLGIVKDETHPSGGGYPTGPFFPCTVVVGWVGGFFDPDRGLASHP